MMRRGYSSYIPQKVSKKEWCKQRKDLRMNLEENCIPVDISGFQLFLDKRRRMMAAYMRRYYESLE